MAEHLNRAPVGGARYAPRGHRAWMRRLGRVHFVGIGGVGMGGIAELMHNLGFVVSGSDIRESAMLRRLAALGIDVRTAHDRASVAGAAVVVVSTAIGDDNCEVEEARAKHIPVVARARMLAELMRLRPGIAVAGTHGKTTTTSLVASVLAMGGLDPTFVIGGRLNSAGANAGLGTGPYVVAEADESDASFLYLQPVMAVVTNIDADHLETYGGDFGRLRRTFLDFLHHLPFYGRAVLCTDDPTVRGLLGEVDKPIVTYGIASDADLVADAIVQEGPRTRFNIHLPEHGASFAVSLNLPGRHNVQNALAAIAVGNELGIAPDLIARALGEFQGIARRIQSWGDLRLPATVTLVDDYGHHPTEIEATLAAVRGAWPGRRMVVVFQPHRYTRTRDLLEDFARVLSECDVLLLLEVYAAGEAPIAGADGRTLCRAVRARGRVDPVFVEGPAAVDDLLVQITEEGDLVLTLGAGDVGALAPHLAERFGAAPVQE